MLNIFWRVLKINFKLRGNMHLKYKKILIVGCGGAGKSTLAVMLGQKLNINVVHLDKLHWLSGWIEREDTEFEILLENELKKESWIIDGNYFRTFEKRLKNAELCIFLDYSTELCINSVKERVDKYAGTNRPDMTVGCIEKVDDEFIEWVHNYNCDIRPKILNVLQNSNVDYLIFTSRKQTQDWLNKIDN